MPGSSCLNCVFAQWEGQTQKGCLLNRLDKYETATIINDDFTGTYSVCVHNICTAKRGKSWLGKNSQRPDIAVRKELYPKLQLIVLIEEYSKEWIDFFYNNRFDKYSAVDILLFDSNTKLIREFNLATVQPNIFIHTCLPVNNPVLTDVQHHINNFVRDDCQFYVTVNRYDSAFVTEWPDRLDSYLNDECKPLYMTWEIGSWEMDEVYNNRLIYTPIHMSFGGYGTQTIEKKIHIHCENEYKDYLIVEVDDVCKPRTS